MMGRPNNMLWLRACPEYPHHSSREAEATQMFGAGRWVGIAHGGEAVAPLERMTVLELLL